eukprot:2865905-Prymnesium_polylepis.1
MLSLSRRARPTLRGERARAQGQENEQGGGGGGGGGALRGGHPRNMGPGLDDDDGNLCWEITR